MSFSIGIVGLPNVGKSTLFKALTKKSVPIDKYPFTTIHPNIGVVKVPDERLDKLAEVLKPKEVLHTTIEFVDIAGLVKDAHKGAGLGNQFLSQIRNCDAILHLLRDFDEDIPSVTNKIDPKMDLEIVKLELIFADLATIEKKIEELRKKIKEKDKIVEHTLEILKKIRNGLNEEKLAKELDLNEEEKSLIKDLNLLTLKPVLYVLNVSENKENEKFNSALTISAKLEAELTDLNEKEIKDLGMEKEITGLDKVIQESYKILDLITFFTSQNQILQAWTIPKETKVVKAAGKIHGDFEKGFIKAEMINWQDLIKVGNEHKAREEGLIKIEGKDYLVNDGDVVHFRFT